MRVCSLALVLLLVSGCSLIPERTVYVEIEPECSVPARPALPEIPAEALDPLPDHVYWDVIHRDARLQDWALEMEVILERVCDQ